MTNSPPCSGTSASPSRIPLQAHPCPPASTPDLSRVLVLQNGSPRKLLSTKLNWTRYTHINGDVYFYNPTLRIITNSDVESDDEERVEVEGVLEDMFDDDVFASAYADGLIPEDWEMVVRRCGIPGEEEDGWDVYCVSRQNNTFIYTTDAEIEVEKNTLRYWTHIEDYPMHLSQLPPSSSSAFLSAMAYGANEMIMENRQSKFPYTDKQIARLTEIYDDLSKTAEKNPAMIPVLAWHIARTLRRVESARMWHRIAHPSIEGFYGFKLQYVHEAYRKKAMLRLGEALLHVVLLGIYTMYWRRLAQVREGPTADLLGFRAMLREFLSEWSDSNLIATVLVGANVTLLSLSNLSSLQRTISLASTLLSIISIAVGLHHVWSHRTKLNAEIIEVSKYMSHTRDYNDTKDDPTDLIIMASFLSVPIASLLWSIATFALAIAAYCVQGTDKVGGIWLSTFMGIIVFVGGGLVIVFWRLWEVKGSKEIIGAQVGMAIMANGPGNFAGGV
ncbi:hypothetical protein BXZ70DRAFT_951160 [Cristinia sonorae]|uniref:WW domain-containing protein n=1 Tax=Cristinia sonorae TaxID=1940300 RepID=A0A8K0UJU5_9AGAR|nr:hypothetical protein BXZ70DRAFT_951160 [Cristinia sonorae]